MTWRAILDGHSPILPAPATRRLLAKGTLLVEIALPERPETCVTLVDYARHDSWDRALRLDLEPGGRISLVERQGPSEVRATLDLDLPEGEVCLRVLYSWDAPARRGRLAAELPASGGWASIAVPDPHPIPEDDLAAMARHLPGRRRTLIAWADSIEPFGPVPGLAAGTPIETAAGMRGIERLQPGDLVRTTENGFQPVRHVISREVPAAGHHAPILLAAPALGLAADIIVAPHHRMLIGGADAEYLFEADAVLVEARHLIPIAAVPIGRPAPTVRYHQIVLDRHECLSIAGAWGESFLMEHTARLDGTMLGPLSGAPLHHTRCANPLLRPYEAVVLVSALVA